MVKELRGLLQAAINKLLNEENIIIVGPRGIGKTYFVNRMISIINSLIDPLTIYLPLNYDYKLCSRIHKVLYTELIKSLKKRFGRLSFFISNLLERFYRYGEKQDLTALRDQIKSEYNLSLIIIGDDFPIGNRCREILSLFSVILTSAPLINQFKSSDKYYIIRLNEVINELLIEYLKHQNINVVRSAIERLMYHTGGLLKYIAVLLPYFRHEERKGLPIDGSFIDILMDNEFVQFLMKNIAVQHDRFYYKFYGKCYRDLLRWIIFQNNQEKELFNVNREKKRCFELLEEIGLIHSGKKGYQLLDKQLMTIYKFSRSDPKKGVLYS